MSIIGDLYEEDIARLNAEIDELRARLAAIGGCANCGGLPHTTDCRWRDPGMLEAKVKELERELEQYRGAKCTDKDCPDYDGAHPYHFNAVELFWDRVQDSYNDAAAPGTEVPAALAWGKAYREQLMANAKALRRIYNLEEALGNHPTLVCMAGDHSPDATEPCDVCAWATYVRKLLIP